MPHIQLLERSCQYHISGPDSKITSLMALALSLSPSKFEFPHLQNGDNKTTFTRLLGGVNEIMTVKMSFLQLRLSKCQVNVKLVNRAFNFLYTHPVGTAAPGKIKYQLPYLPMGTGYYQLLPATSGIKWVHFFYYCLLDSALNKH